jgi:hypothetical protein
VKGSSITGPNDDVKKFLRSGSCSSVSKLKVKESECRRWGSKKSNRGDEREEDAGDVVSDALRKPGRLKEEPGNIWPLGREGEPR